MVNMKEDRLTAQDWAQAGLKALAEAGFTALKADTLARSLGVSRGSFYWHFADVSAFHEAVLQRWHEVAYDNIVAELEATESDRLAALLKRAFPADPRLERAIRAWAVSEPDVRKAVEAVDARRVSYIERLLTEAGVDKARAVARAQLLYWAYLGHIFSTGRLDRGMVQAALAELYSAALAGVRMKSKSHPSSA